MVTKKPKARVAKREEKLKEYAVSFHATTRIYAKNEKEVKNMNFTELSEDIDEWSIDSVDELAKFPWNLQK